MSSAEINPSKSTVRIILTGIAIIIVFMVLVVTILALLDYQKIKEGKTVDKARADTMYVFIAIVIFLVVCLLAYTIYLMYKELFPSHIETIKAEAISYLAQPEPRVTTTRAQEFIKQQRTVQQREA